MSQAASEPASQDASQPAHQAAPEPRRRKGRTIRSVDRALTILDILSDGGGEMALSEIAARSGLNISTCHHLLSTLHDRGYVAQNPDGRAYFLGAQMLALSVRRARHLDLVDAAMPALRRLAAETGHTVHLSVMQGTDLATLIKLDASQPDHAGPVRPVRRQALHATASGKAILAGLDDARIARLLKQSGLGRFTPATHGALAPLMEDVRAARASGIALDREEFEPGTACVGAGVQDRSGATVAAVACSMPVARAHGEHLDHVIGCLRRCVRAISAGLETAPRD